MTIPERVQLTTPMTIGFHAVMGACITIALVAALYLANISLQPLGFFAFLLVLGPTISGAYLDKRAKLKDKTEQLNLHGFLRCKAQDIDPTLITALSQMKPYKFKKKTIRRAFHGTDTNQEIYITQHRVGDGEDDIIFTACAVWSPLDLPSASIRRLRLKDKIARINTKDQHTLGEHHIIHSLDKHLIQTISMMHPWFALKSAKPRNFRIHQPPGLKEQWAIAGHWIIYADLGNADTKGTLKLTEFLVAFVEELESQFIDELATPTQSAWSMPGTSPTTLQA